MTKKGRRIGEASQALIYTLNDFEPIPAAVVAD